MIARVVDPGVTIPRWLLRFGLGVMAVTAVVLVAVIVGARLARHRRHRREQSLVTPLRPQILEIASGEDEGRARAALLGVVGDQREVVDESLVRMLAKVRGEPAEQIVEVLRAHGFDQGAIRDLSSWRYSKRAHAAWTLGLMGRADAVPALVARLGDSSYSVALTAARALGMIGDPSVAPALLDSLAPSGRHEPAMPSWAVVEALTRLGSAVSGAVGAAFDSPHAPVRAAAAKVTALTPLFSCADEVRDALATEPDPLVRVDLLRALGMVGRAPDVGVIDAFTRPTEQVSVRRAAARALGEIGAQAARDRLVEMLADPDPQVVEDATIGLLAAGPRGEEALRAARRGQLVPGTISDEDRLAWATERTA